MCCWSGCLPVYSSFWELQPNHSQPKLLKQVMRRTSYKCLALNVDRGHRSPGGDVKNDVRVEVKVWVNNEPLPFDDRSLILKPVTDT